MNLFESHKAFSVSTGSIDVAKNRQTSADTPHGADYLAHTCVNTAVFSFYVGATLNRDLGTGIKIIPLQDGGSNWPNLTYTIQGSLDGIHYEDLPTPISAVAVTTAPVAADMMFLPFSVYRVQVTCGSANGLFAVISNRR